MVQGAGLVNVIVANNKWYFDDAGTRIRGDGVTADDVLPKEASNLAAAGALVAASDVKILSSDFTDYITPQQNKSRL